MSDVTTAASAASSTPANSAETPASTTENTSLSADEEAAEAALDTADGSTTDDAAKMADSKDKSAKKDDKSKKKVEKEIEKRVKKLKLKVDGKEIEESLDLDNDEELVRHLQMAKMGQKRAQEKAELEKQVQSFMQALGNNPMKALKDLGLDPTQIIDGYINEQLENARKTPEQLAKEQLEGELKRLKDERETEKKQRDAQEFQRLQEQAFQQYDIQMEQVLNKSDLPKTPYVIKKMADYMLVALEAGKDVSPEDVVDLVREEMHNDIQTLLGGLPEDKVEELLGEQQLSRLRKRRIAKAQAAQKIVSKPQVQDTGKTGKGDDKPKDKVSFKQFFGV